MFLQPPPSPPPYAVGSPVPLSPLVSLVGPPSPLQHDEPVSESPPLPLLGELMPEVLMPPDESHPSVPPPSPSFALSTILPVTLEDTEEFLDSLTYESIGRCYVGDLDNFLDSPVMYAHIPFLLFLSAY